MGSVFAGWYKASVYDPATGDVVQLNKLSIENTAWEEEIITNDSTQSNVYGGKRYKLTLAFFDTDGLSQLEAWQRNRTPVRAVAAGPTNLQWYESVPVKVTKLPRADKRSGLNLYQIEMEAWGINPSIYTNQNLLAYLGWQDANSDGLADGWQKGPATNLEFTAGVQIFTPTNAESVQKGIRVAGLQELVFPISGVKITVSAIYPNAGQISTSHSSSYYYLNSYLSQLSQTSTAINSNLDAERRITRVLSLPSSVFWVGFTPHSISNSAAFNDTLSFAYPCITTNGKLTPSNEFMAW